MKQFLALFVCALVLLPAINAYAQTDYVLLAPLPGLETTADLNTGEGAGVGKYFSTIYQIGVSLALVIAVVMLIYGGIQYMMSDSIGGKSNGRETITKAIIGIVLAVSSYALLYLIGGSGAVTVGFDMPEGIEYVAPGGVYPDSVTVSPEELMRDPNETETPETPVATKEADHPDIEMELLEATQATGGASLIYQTTWEGIPESATLVLELYQERNPGSNEFNQLIRTYNLGDLGPDGGGDLEVGQVDIDAGTLANPTIARMKIFDSSGTLLEEYLHGFEGVPVSN